ncbi:hypothetical protein B5F41_08550 [Gordonibacter sp. An232A]|nr:hypothetical protein B5F41_08550 [Gordonibacter sp. An232A]
MLCVAARCGAVGLSSNVRLARRAPQGLRVVQRAWRERCAARNKLRTMQRVSRKAAYAAQRARRVSRGSPRNVRGAKRIVRRESAVHDTAPSALS